MSILEKYWYNFYKRY